MRENRLSGLMRGGSQAVIGRMPSQSADSCLLYTSLKLFEDRIFFRSFLHRSGYERD